MAAPQLPVNFDPAFLRDGGRSCFVKNVSLWFNTERVIFNDSVIVMTTLTSRARAPQGSSTSSLCQNVNAQVSLPACSV